jgi:hypothetical protein
MQLPISEVMNLRQEKQGGPESRDRRIAAILIDSTDRSN